MTSPELTPSAIAQPSHISGGGAHTNAFKFTVEASDLEAEGVIRLINSETLEETLLSKESFDLIHRYGTGTFARLEEKRNERQYLFLNIKEVYPDLGLIKSLNASCPAYTFRENEKLVEGVPIIKWMKIGSLYGKKNLARPGWKLYLNHFETPPLTFVEWDDKVGFEDIVSRMSDPDTLDVQFTLTSQEKGAELVGLRRARQVAKDLETYLLTETLPPISVRKIAKILRDNRIVPSPAYGRKLGNEIQVRVVRVNNLEVPVALDIRFQSQYTPGAIKEYLQEIVKLTGWILIPQEKTDPFTKSPLTNAFWICPPLTAPILDQFSEGLCFATHIAGSSGWF